MKPARAPDCWIKATGSAPTLSGRDVDSRAGGPLGEPAATEGADRGPSCSLGGPPAADGGVSRDALGRERLSGGACESTDSKSVLAVLCGATAAVAQYAADGRLAAVELCPMESKAPWLPRVSSRVSMLGRAEDPGCTAGVTCLRLILMVHAACWRIAACERLLGASSNGMLPQLELAWNQPAKHKCNRANGRCGSHICRDLDTSN